MLKQTIALAMALTLTACSSNNIEDRIEKINETNITKAEIKSDKMDNLIDSVPDWYMDIPQPDGTGFYGVGYGTSNKPPFALKSAELQAKFDLVKSFKQLVSGQERSYENQTMDANIESQVNILIDSLVEEQSVAGFQRVKRELYNVDGVANAYVLLKMPYDEYNKALQSMRAKSVEKKMEMAFNELQKILDKRKQVEMDRNTAKHRREVELKELDIKRVTELRKAELQQQEGNKAIKN